MIEMKCPFCDKTGGLTGTHQHLLEVHLPQVYTQRNEENGKMQYIVHCPFCDLEITKEVKPRSRNPRFLEDFKAEIAMVAFDQLLYHVLQEHSNNVGVNLAELNL